MIYMCLDCVRPFVSRQFEAIHCAPCAAARKVGWTPYLPLSELARLQAKARRREHIRYQMEREHVKINPFYK